MTPVVIDYDAVAFRAAAAAQKATIKVVHKETGREWEFDNRTALWGRYKTKSGGWIKKQKEKGIEYSPEDFIIEDVVTPEPLANAIQISKRIVERIVKGVGADSYYGYVGPDKCFRNDIATLLPYKGAREGVARPVHLLDVKSYLVKHHAGERVEGIETDDQMTIDTWDAYKRGLDLWGAAIDKDFKGCTGKWYNFVDDTKLIVGTELGELKRLPKKIDGHDIRHGQTRFAAYYTPSDKMKFMKYMECLNDYDVDDIDILKDLFLGIYANPVSNKIKLGKI